LIFQRDTAFQLALRLTMRRIAATLAVVVALLFSAGSAWADYDDGWAAAQRGDFATAFREWLPLAEQGDAAAQYNLGLLYDHGQHVPQNYYQAFNCYRKAAEQSGEDAKRLLKELED
jgi:TPR repeat protein